MEEERAARLLIFFLYLSLRRYSRSTNEPTGRALITTITSFAIEISLSYLALLLS